MTRLSQSSAIVTSGASTSRMGWQKASGYNRRAKVEAAIGRWKQVIGDGLRSRIDERRVTAVDIAVHVLNRMLELGRPNYVRITLAPNGDGGHCVHSPDPCTTLMRVLGERPKPLADIFSLLRRS